uniref:Fibrinogen C-terminal domain-containing protein n=1 Tax=Magallana gigas TaxID=29159 RepID=A0A8W8MAE8_MAGGI|nr:ficolin-1-like [Crassostrea gigas]
MDHDNVWKYAEYSTFNVESGSFKYRLHVNGYSGNAGDSLWLHDGMSFTTYDNDNDNNGTVNCGSLFRGGWWYHTCHTANLNGEYGNTIKSKGINWYYWKGFYYSMKEVRMMVRKP